MQLLEVQESVCRVIHLEDGMMEWDVTKKNDSDAQDISINV